jgi:hypothetical protein
MLELLIVVVIVGVIALFFGRKNIARLFGAGRGQAGKLSRAAAKADPMAMYQVQIDEAVDKLRSTKLGLDSFKGLVNRVKRQVEEGRASQKILEARIEYWLAEDNKSKATEEAVKLQRVEKDLAENEGQLKDYNKAYQVELNEMTEARQQIASAQEKSRHLQGQLDLSEAAKEAGKLLSDLGGVGTGGIADVLGGLGEAERAIQDKIDENRGSAEVTSDLSADLVAEREADEAIEKAGAEEILARFKNKAEKKAAK